MCNNILTVPSSGRVRPSDGRGDPNLRRGLQIRIRRFHTDISPSNLISLYLANMLLFLVGSAMLNPTLVMVMERPQRPEGRICSLGEPDNILQVRCP